MRTYIYWDTSTNPPTKLLEVECKYTEEADVAYKKKFKVSPLGKKNISCTIKKETNDE